MFTFPMYRPSWLDIGWQSHADKSARKVERVGVQQFLMLFLKRHFMFAPLFKRLLKTHLFGAWDRGALWRFS